MAKPTRTALLGRGEKSALAFLATLPAQTPPELRTHLAVAAFLNPSAAVNQVARKRLKPLMPADYAALSRRLSKKALSQVGSYSENHAADWLVQLERLSMDLSVLAPVIARLKRTGRWLCWQRGFIDDHTFLKGFRKGDAMKIPIHGLHLPDAIGELTNLRKLDLAESGLKALPATLANLSALEELDLRGCSFTTIPFDLRCFPALRVLHLGGVPLTTLPTGMFDLPALEELFVSGPALMEDDFARLGELRSLRQLGLFSTDRTTLPDSIGALSELEMLMLYQTKVAALPDSMVGLEKLKHISIDFTPIRNLPAGIAKPGLHLLLVKTGMSQKQKASVRANFSSCTIW